VDSTIVGAREPRPEGDGAPGWYPDPLNPAGKRAWDGAMWTDRTMSAALAGIGTYEDRYAISTLWWGGLGLLCSFLPLVSWLAVFLCGPFAILSWRRNRRAAEESGKTRPGAVKVGLVMGIVGMVIGAVAIPIYWVMWSQIFPAS